MLATMTVSVRTPWRPSPSDLPSRSTLTRSLLPHGSAAAPVGTVADWTSSPNRPVIRLRWTAARWAASNAGAATPRASSTTRVHLAAVQRNLITGLFGDDEIGR